MYPERAIDPLQFPPKQKVYVVTKYKDIRYNYEEEVHKVFSTLEKAEEYIKVNADFGFFSGIEEFEVE